MRTTRGRLIMAVIVGLIAVVSYFGKKSINPITGEEQYVSLTPEQEIALGIQSAPEIAAQFGGLYNDNEAQNLVKRVGAKIVSGTAAGSSPYQFDFHVLADDQTVNAFALPGGQIFITVALLSRLKTEDQLAGVLGHEIGHVIGRHSAEHMAQQELTQGLISAGQIATNDPNMIASYVGQMISMKFGREDELESDEFGVHYMYETGYNPQGMIEVMEILAAASSGSSTPEFQSTHPSPENRIEKLEEIIASL
ncbi:MAG: M48 family metalloprotease [Cyclobacteriaceae bacterium]|nr:M48 family metalloprotease [Cyclobacteriaceae bacterium]